MIGYPGGDAEQVVAAAVSGDGDGDAATTSMATRWSHASIEVLAARVIPGNSGGPIVNDNGQIIGVVFAASTTQTNVGYALTIPQV